MNDDTGSAPFEAYWRRTLVENDFASHVAEAGRAVELENEGLRLRCAELAAALTQARAAIELRHSVMTAQMEAIAERDAALARAREELEEARAGYRAVVGSRRWRAGDLGARAAAASGRLIQSLRRPS